jgi:hypothetical protein
MPGIAASTGASVAQEFHVLGWSKGYLGFTSAFAGKMQSVSVTSSADGLHWHKSGRLDLGSDDAAIVVTQLVEGPAGLLAMGEVAGCALHKPAVRMWRSVDGVSWTPVDLAGVFGADSLAGASGGSAGYIVLAAAGKERTVWTSMDGASWHKSVVPSGGFGAQDVASFQRGFIVAGTTRVLSGDCAQSASGPYVGSVWASLDGSPWTSVKLPKPLVGTQASMSLYRLNDETILADEGATSGSGQDATSQQRAWTSRDGLTWQQSDSLLGMYPLTDGTRTVFADSTDQGQPEIWTLTPDLRLVKLSAGADAPTPGLDGQAALGPAGVVVTDSSGAASWLGVPVP